MPITERIAVARRAANLTQAQAAHEIGVTPNTWARWERGEVGLKERRIREVARVLGIKPGKLLS